MDLSDSTKGLKTLKLKIHGEGCQRVCTPLTEAVGEHSFRERILLLDVKQTPGAGIQQRSQKNDAAGELVVRGLLMS